ncbi:hypothetical protein DAMA08_007530 [Martiniozyma asiatica (nom. inval.)]|nr:hypothetical protein DAMA08_007530 [Martiniozyma asiatica]
MLNIGVPPNIDTLFKFEDDVSNVELFVSWKPKINAYREALEKAQSTEFRTSTSHILSTIDTESLNNVKFLNESNTLSDKEKEITSLTAT